MNLDAISDFLVDLCGDLFQTVDTTGCENEFQVMRRRPRVFKGSALSNTTGGASDKHRLALKASGGSGGRHDGSDVALVEDGLEGGR